MPRPTNAGDKRKTRKCVKLDEAETKRLRVENKLSITDIARHQNVAPSTVWRYLEKHNIDQDIDEFKKNRADILSVEQIESKKIKFLIKQGYTADVLAQMSHSEKIALLKALDLGDGLMYDKERLERGQSTVNLAGVFSKAMESDQ